MDLITTYRRTLRFEPVDYVLSHAPVYGIHYYGANHEGFHFPDGDDSPTGTRWVDVWGTGWHKIHPDVMGMPEVTPLADLANLRTYPWPSPDDERLCAQVYQMAEQFRQDPRSQTHLLGGSHRDTLWEKAYMLVGMENMMAYFKSEPSFAREVLHRIMNFQIGMTRHYLSAGIQVVHLGDDLGTQIGPLLGPRIVAEFLVPEYRRLFELYKSKGVIISFHSCGNLYDGRPHSLLETFLDLGVDSLNPIQATANDLDQVRAITQGRMALEGGVSSAVIMEGPIQRIEEEVRHRLRQLGSQGGYICHPDQGMPYPPDHLRAVYEAVEKFGRYPLE